MRFSSKSNDITISAKDIIKKVTRTNVDVFERGYHDSGVMIILNGAEDEIVHIPNESGTLYMYIIPFEEVSIYHYNFNRDNKSVVKEPVRISYIKNKEIRMLFDFATGYLINEEQQVANM